MDIHTVWQSPVHVRAIERSRSYRIELDQLVDGTWSLRLSGDFTGVASAAVLSGVAARISCLHHAIHVQAVDVVDISVASARSLRQLEERSWPPVVTDAVSPAVARRFADLPAREPGLPWSA